MSETVQEPFAAARGYAAPVELPQASATGVEWAERSGRSLPPVLDVCCGGRMMWFEKAHPLALYMDKRRETVRWDEDKTNRKLEVNPDVLGSFCDMPFPDESFHLVVFDPPHFDSLGEDARTAKMYGRLFGDWECDLTAGFRECFRVLKPFGTLVFKWNSYDIPLERVLALAPERPLFGHTTGRQAKTHWVTFLKGGGGAERQGEKPSPTEARHT